MAKSRINPSLRLWLMFVAVFLASTISFIAVVWPPSDPAVVADIGAPACAAWRETAAADMPDVYPEPGQACYALRSLMYHERVSVRSVADYDAWLAGRRARTVLKCFGVWAGFSLGVYVLGWSARRITQPFDKRREPKAG